MPSVKIVDGHCRRVAAMAECESTEEALKREQLVVKHLTGKRAALEEQLLSKLEQLKTICIREGELTGEIPPDIYKTLLPWEAEPKVKRRVGTTFKFSDQVLTRTSAGCESGVNVDEENAATTQLEADIELHRKIVAAAERLAKDKSTNKSVRKKRRKDWQAAYHRLKGLEKGLYKLRISNSKPDVTSGFETMSCGNVGSGFSLNSLKGWPNIVSHAMKVTARSCPSTPHGSLRDLSTSQLAITRANTCSDYPSTSADACSLLSLATDDRRPPRRSSSKSKLLSAISPRLRTYSSKVVSNGDLPSPRSTSFVDAAQLPPAVPNRRAQPSAFASGHDTTDVSRLADHEPPLYANIGYASSVSYKSAYRQSNFPTFQDSRNASKSSLSTRFSVERMRGYAHADGGYVFEYSPPTPADDSAIRTRRSNQQSDNIDMDALASQFAKFTRNISGAMSSTGSASSSSSLRAHIQLQQQNPMSQSNGAGQRCSTASQASSVSIGSISSTSSSSGYISLVNGASAQQLYVGLPQSVDVSNVDVRPPSRSSLGLSSYVNSTTSLDRRAMRSGFSSSALLAASAYDNFHIENGLETRFQTQNNLLTTTFPVNDYCRPLELSDFSQFRSNSSAAAVPRMSHELAVAATMKRSSTSAREFPRFHALVASSAKNSWSFINTTKFQSYKPIKE